MWSSAGCVDSAGMSLYSAHTIAIRLVEGILLLCVLLTSTFSCLYAPSSFMRAREALATMRADHERNKCGFFAFTVVRSPLDWVVSLYNDICHRRLRGHKDTCPQKVGMAVVVGGSGGRSGGGDGGGGGVVFGGAGGGCGDGLGVFVVAATVVQVS